MGTTNEEESGNENVETKQSQPRWFFVGMALFFMVLVFIGFGPNYFLPLLSGEEVTVFTIEMSWIVHLHALIFGGWVALLITQALLINQSKTDIHMSLGRYGIGFGVLLLMMGSAMSYMSVQGFVSNFGLNMKSAIIAAGPSWIGMLTFAVLLFLGYKNRFNPQAHKRYMIFATIAILFAAIDRMHFLLGDKAGLIMFVIIMIPILAHDYYAQHKIHPATRVGGTLLTFYAGYIHLFLSFYLPDIFG